MNKKYLLAAGMIVLACACQPKAQQNGDTQKKEQPPRPQGGCCETEKPQAAPKAEAVVAPVVEQKAAVAPQQSQPTAATPEVKVESKAP